MKDSDKGFEDYFKEAFEGAELSPQPKVWQGIDKALGTGGQKIRPLYVHFGRLAAAAMLLIGAWVYVLPEFVNKKIVDTKTVPSENTPIQDNAITKEGSAVEESHQNSTDPTAETSGQNSEPISGGTQATSPQVDLPARPEAIKVMPKEYNAQKGYRNGKQADPSGEPIPGQTLVNVANDGSGQKVEQGVNTPMAQPEILSLAEVGRLPLLAVVVGQPFPLAIQPQLVVLAKPSALANRPRWWIGAGATYGTFQPNFGSLISSTPSPYVISLVQDRSLDSTQPGDLNNHLTRSRAASFSLEFGRKLGKNFGVSSGLMYLAYDYRANTTVTQTVSFDLQSPRSNYIANTISSRASYLAVPLRLWVQSDRAGLNYRASAGLLANVALQSSTDSEFSAIRYDFGTSRPVHLSAMGSLGLQYNFGSWGIYTDLNYNRALQSVYSTDKLRSTPQWFGLGIGTLYQF
jgi:Outer membrane protein beta-barrel domain